MVNSKAIKINCIVRCSSVITIRIQSYPMSSHWFALMQIYYILPIFYFWYIFISKLVNRWGGIKSLASSNYSFTCSTWSFPCSHYSFKLSPNVPYNLPRNLSFCYFASFLIVSLTPFIIKPDFSKDLTVFMTWLIFSSFETINVVTPDPKASLWIVVILMELKHL